MSDKTIFLVLAPEGEGYLTDCLSDARHAAGQRQGAMPTTLASEFRECYAHDTLDVIEIPVEALKGRKQ